MTITLSSLSLEYVRVPVRALEAGRSVNPTTDSVAFAFTSDGAEPDSGDWHDGSWETVSGIYYARILVGPGGVVLADGSYSIWLKVTDDPEIPIRLVGTLVVT